MPKNSFVQLDLFLFSICKCVQVGKYVNFVVVVYVLDDIFSQVKPEFSLSQINNVVRARKQRKF